MYHFLLGNKKYKYEEFFIDEYKELDDFMVYIENKILSFYAKVIYTYNIEKMNKIVQYNKIKTVIINGRNKCIYMKPRGTREYVKYNKEFILLNRYIKLISKNLKKQKGGTRIEQATQQNTERDSSPNINYSYLSAHANDKDSFDLLKSNVDKIDWDTLSTNTDPRAVEILSTNPVMINWELFNKNQTEANKNKLKLLLGDRAYPAHPQTQQTQQTKQTKQPIQSEKDKLKKDILELKKMRSQLQKRPMPLNPYHYFEESKMTKLSEFNHFGKNNIRPVNWDALSTNRNIFALDLLIKSPQEINWKLFNIFQTKENKDYLINSLSGTSDTRNDYIDDYVKKHIQGSAFAISSNETFLKKNLKGKNFWDALSINKSRHALDLLIKNFKQIIWKYFIKYQPVENKEYVLNSLLLGHDSHDGSFQENVITNHYISPYLHLLEGRASTDMDFINLGRLIPDIDWNALSTNTDRRAVEILFSNIPKVNLGLFNAFQSDLDKNLMKRELNRVLLENFQKKSDR